MLGGVHILVDISYNDNKYVVVVPQKIANNIYSFDRILYIFYTLESVRKKEIYFDFSKTTWFDANLSSVFGALFLTLFKNENKVKVGKMKKKIRNILEKNEFLSTFGLNSQPDVFNTTIKFKVFHKENKTEFQNYIDKSFLPKISIDMSEDFKSLFSSALEEIYQNARTHGQSCNITTCGQWYPSRNSIKFTICDIGITIPENVSTKLEGYTPKEAIHWATQFGTSTKPKTENGGIGLHYLKDFIKLNGGEMHIVSGSGYWGHIKEVNMKNLKGYFNGTIVSLDINLSDEKMYICLDQLGIAINKENNIIENMF